MLLVLWDSILRSGTARFKDAFKICNCYGQITFLRLQQSTFPPILYKTFCRCLKFCMIGDLGDPVLIYISLPMCTLDLLSYAYWFAREKNGLKYGLKSQTTWVCVISQNTWPPIAGLGQVTLFFWACFLSCTTGIILPISKGKLY